MKRRHKFYFICIIGLLILITTAFLVPQFIFEAQDGFRERNIVVGKRGSLDITKLNLSYEKSLFKRMTSFSQGIAQEKKYYVAATTYTAEDYNADNEELDNIIDNIAYSYSMTLLYQTGLLSELIFYPFDENNVLNSLKRYVIYDEDFQNGAALMAWYVDLSLEGTIRLRMLVDIETSTIYYAQIDYPEEMRDYILSRMVYFIYDYESAYYVERIVNREYETDKRLDVSPDEEPDEIYDVSITGQEQNIKEFIKSYEPQEFVQQVFLYYDNGYLEYKIEYLEQDNRLTMGITEIGGLIPDFTEE